MKKFTKIVLISVLSIIALFIAFTLLNVINAIAMKNYINTFDKVEYENQLTPTTENGETYFTTDSDFKILQITDVHLTGGILFSRNDRKAINAVSSMISTEKPDLVIFTGDVSFAVPYSGTINNNYAHTFLTQIMERLGVYYTVAFGNHDSEAYNFLNRNRVATIYENENLTYSLFTNNDGDVYGECNHVINVKNSLGLITQSLIILDTNSYTKNDLFGLKGSYDKVHDSQISWYENTINALKAKNQTVYNNLSASEKNGQTQELKSLAFFHIPPTEVKTAYREYLNNGNQNTQDVIFKGGYSGEEVCSPSLEDEFFEKALELQSTQAMFFGHDHVNNYVLNYKGITLSYGYSIDYSAYVGIASKGYQRGSTLITLTPSGEFNISHQNYYQDKYQPKYEKEKVNMEIA